MFHQVAFTRANITLPDRFRTRKIALAMAWKRKKDTSEEMSYLVDYYDKLSNLLDAIRALNDFSNHIERK